MRAVFCVILAFAAGCQASLPFDRMDAAQQAALIEKYRGECTAFGFKKGTNAFANCVQTAVIERDRALNLRRAAMTATMRPCGPGTGFYGGCL